MTQTSTSETSNPDPSNSQDSDEIQHPGPEHVAIIMDGNGRWATSQGMNRSQGHRAGTDNVRRILRAFNKNGVKYVTLYAFSTENWGRPNDEVQALMELIWEAIRREVQNLHEEGVRILHLGRLDRLNPGLRSAISDSVELTKNNSELTLCVAFDYGGRAEILNAIQSMLADGVNPDDVTEDLFRGYLYTHEIPDPDLIIRTAGDMRLSNFLIWQAAYSEFYFTSVFWPDFDQDDVTKAIAEYNNRKRRFGKVSPE